ncbi:DUF5107 domain-containing protein [Microbacterium sp. Marseille-Q6648]|uniref:DUF5107 domain-containing protein n=1 Tax=Microbacterium sp. Marseille-Q6648 TaxID=2937991 RepID=UPI00203D65F0|nr:DUF5107 domain-containing protein [Microbacterium sp. Marseille-Q6648]
MTRDPDAASRIVLPDAPDDQRALLDAGGVACWSEDVIIDTYEPGTPDPYPLFLERRVYQGSSGRVYPMPMIDTVAHVKSPRAWKAVHLENAYVRLLLLPEIGGRIHIGYDKVAGYDFFYRNNVIKPALVGLAGPWISGGVEFNWPQHHRPATFLPVEWRIEREADDSVVVWHTDLDPLQRMRGTHGVRLRGGSSLIEADVVLHNRTDVAQTFLWWANVAARAHERYQSFFPDDVRYVADHARRAITAFPRADRPYYGVDYPALARDVEPDADRLDVYSSIPVPTSYMITDTRHDFFGGYDHAAEAGFVHWADRAVSPGKKQWTWGDGPIGHAWDAQLTDDDGPYVELMAGVYTDNQPDFSWLAPGETKRFSQFWYPIHRIGPARQASRDAAISVSGADGLVRIGVLATRAVDDALITVSDDSGILTTATTTLSPARPHLLEVDTVAAVARVEVRSGDEVLVAWERPTGEAVVPWVATAPDAPEEVASNDELYLTAVHLMQYRHPTRSPLPYLEEALRRDPADSRSATALAAERLRRGRYDEAKDLLDTTVDRLTRRNLNPRDGEAVYLRGLVHERLGDDVAADADFAKAAWNHAWTAAASLARARIALRTGRTADAILHARSAGGIPEAERIVVLALRRQGHDGEAARRLAELRRTDPLDAATAALAGALDVVDPRTPLDVATEFARAGAWDDAVRTTAGSASSSPALGAFVNPEPLRHYLRAVWLDAQELGDQAREARREAREADAAYAFPAGLDQYDALRSAVDADADDLRAHALLGMWLLDAGRIHDALPHLMAATAGGSDDPVAWRNLALATVESGGDKDAADRAFAHALTLRRDARLVLERDVLGRLRGLSPVERLALLEQQPDLLLERDDLALAYVTLLLEVDRIAEAWDILTARTFRPFEGGEGRVIAAFDRASCEIARDLIRTDPTAAARLMEDGIRVPAHLGEGRHPAAPLAERLVVWGDALLATGDRDAATAAWWGACSGTPHAVAPRPPVEADYWVGVAHLRLGEDAAAEEIWSALERRADDLARSQDAVDYFATSLPELLLFDVDTAAARADEADRLRALAAEGRRIRTLAGTTKGDRA